MKKIVHTADWHLGAKLGPKGRLDEQKGFLDWFCGLLAAETPRADLLVVSGDVFDSGAPSNEALAAFYGFLRRVDREALARHVVVIGGNHDSPSLLGAPKPVLEGVRTLVVPEGADSPEGIAAAEAFALDCGDGGQLAVAAVPFLRPAQLANAARAAGVPDGATQAERFDEGFRAHCAAAAAAARRKAAAGSPLVFAAHGSFAGATPSDDISETARRTVGGLDEIAPDALPAADYVALGHYHRRQTVGGDGRVRYAGAPIPMSFAESDQPKGVLVAEFPDGGGVPAVREADYPDAQAFWRFRGTTAEVEAALRARLEAEPDSTAWIEATMEEKGGDGPAFRRKMRELVKGRAVTLLVVRAEEAPGAAAATLAAAAGQDLASFTPLSLARRRLESMKLPAETVEDYMKMLEMALDPGADAGKEATA